MSKEAKMSEHLLNKSESSEVPPEYQQLGYLSEVWLLTYKNIILTIKNPKNIIFLIITPFILSAFMAGIQWLARDNGNRFLENPPLRSLISFPKCSWGNDCVSLDYRVISNGPNNTDWIESVLAQVESSTGMKKGTDIQTGNHISKIADLQSYYNYLQEFANKTQIGVIFCAEQDKGLGYEDNLTNFCGVSQDYTYYLVLKKVNSLGVIFHDLEEPFPIDDVANALKILIDNAILRYKSSPDSSLIHFVTSQFPVGPNRYIQNYDIISAIGAFYYMITPLFAFLFIQNEIVREKEYRLRQGLNIFGARHSCYWISWFLIAAVYALTSSISTFLAGLSFGFDFFTQTPFYIIIFFLMFPFTLSIQMMSFFLSTLSPTVKAANAVSYGVVLLAIVVQSFVSDNNLLKFLFTTDASSLVQGLKIFLIFYPPFSYTKIFTNITEFSGYHFDISQRSWITADPHYNLDIFGKSIGGYLPGNGTYDRYSDLVSMLILYGDGIFFLILTWYFDHVISSNRGRGESVWFPFKRIYRCFIKKPSHQIQQLNIKKNPAFLIQEEEESAINERNRVMKNAERGIPALGLRIKNLSKTFQRFFSKEKVEAVRHLSLQIEPNQLMAILGHNGAGKTTLINILTGVISPDDDEDTEIIINKESIEKINEIRKHIGVCSQFDILWEELTAYEHLYMFSKLKNIPVALINTKISETLQFVNLLREKDNLVKGFSGGMKRRLSLAISAIGNPKIILLDEPTTGLDPKVKQQVWVLIQKLKKGKSILLTTHSMEEADVLSDRVCVMVKGKLKCVGTSLYLKSKYGEGHRITLNIDKKQTSSVMGKIKKLFPTSNFVDFKGGNLIIGINEYDNLVRFIKMLESQESLGLDQYDLKTSIKDWNVSHTTLEEVFMKVTKEKEE